MPELKYGDVFVNTSFSKQNLVNKCFRSRFSCKNVPKIYSCFNENQYYFGNKKSAKETILIFKYLF